MNRKFKRNIGNINFPKKYPNQKKKFTDWSIYFTGYYWDTKVRGGKLNTQVLETIN